ncbi:GtrA family protein [Bradyrhizobium sp. CB82]|uniref:GtrA family protein n=1 Tax=Bradyrhizobium sp. CB82 TaxID=3039159 RepID=UPI0024B1A922|nr:GtrA family protein [Bradyrhizobium sp. CB82]WFU38848.1 GtrA family protein [Bradyrhizobium sp. CB82]
MSAKTKSIIAMRINALTLSATKLASGLLNRLTKTELWMLLGFGVTGFISFLFYTAGMYLMILAGFGQVVGAMCGFVLGTVVSYSGNTLWVFRTKPTTRNMTKFSIVTIAGLVANICMADLLERMHVRPITTVLVIFATVPFLNYLGHRIWTYPRYQSG